jgi:hypothetical protein
MKLAKTYKNEETTSEYLEYTSTKVFGHTSEVFVA